MRAEKPLYSAIRLHLFSLALFRSPTRAESFSLSGKRLGRCPKPHKYRVLKGFGNNSCKALYRNRFFRQIGRPCEVALKVIYYTIKSAAPIVPASPFNFETVISVSEFIADLSGVKSISPTFVMPPDSTIISGSKILTIPDNPTARYFIYSSSTASATPHPSATALFVRKSECASRGSLLSVPVLRFSQFVSSKYLKLQQL